MNKAPREPRAIEPHAAAAVRPGQRLPYAVELWNLGRTAPERVIARAASLSLARILLAAAAAEHPHRRIVLRKGAQVIEATVEPGR